MKSSTLLISTLVAAAMSVPAFALNNATTEYNGTTYSGDIYKITNTSNAGGLNALTAEKYDSSTQTFSGTYGGEESYTHTNNTTQVSYNGWLANNGDSDYVGNTLLLSAATSAGNAYTYTFDYGHVWVGGLITEGNGSYTIGRAGNTNVHIAGANNVNMNIAANTTIQSTSTETAYGTISVETSGTWNVSSGKTLTLTAGRGLSFADSVSVNVSGEGSLNIGSGTAVTLGSSSALTIGESSTLSGVTAVSGTGTLTVNGTLSLAGKLTNSATVAFGSGSNLTLTGDLATAYGDDYVAGGYIDKDGTAATDGNGYVESASVTVISGEGTFSGETNVTHSDSSGVLSGTLDSSGKVSFGADYRTYHLNSAGETAFDSSLFHADTTTVSVASGATLKLENETTSFDSRTLSIGGAGTVEINVHDTTEQTFSTANVLTGGISVVKTGNSDAALSVAQSYSGGTTVEAGRICVGADGALGTGTVTLSGGTLIAQRGVSLVNDVHVASSDSKINTNSATVTISGAVSADDGVAFNKTGAGTLVLSGTADLGTLNVGAGAVQLSSTNGNYSTAGTRFDVGTVSLANGATLQTVGQGFSFDSVSVADNGTGTLQLTDTRGVLNQTVTIGELSGTNATLNLASTVTLNTNDNGYYARFTLGSADMTVSGDDFSGTIHIQNSATDTRQSSVIIANENIAKNAVMTFDKSGHSLGLGLTASNVNIAGLTSDSTTTGSVTVFSGTNSGAAFASDGTARTLTISTAADASYTYAGTILGDVNLVKDGAGTQTLNGASASFDGDVSILAGVLALGNAAAIGGTADAKTSVTIEGGQMSVAQNVELNATAITVVLSDVYSDAAAILGEGSLASGTTVTLDMDLASSVAALAAETTQTTYSYHLFGNTSLSENLGEDAITLSDTLAAAGYTFSFDSASGVVTLSMIPEPSAFGLLAGLGALALVAARRRRRAK